MVSEQASHSELMRQIQQREKAGLITFMAAMSVFPGILVLLLVLAR